MDYSQWKKGSVLHINLTSIVHNLICKVNKHVALRLQLDSMAVSFYFRNFANGSGRKGLSAFTGKFPSLATGLHLVLRTSFAIESYTNFVMTLSWLFVLSFQSLHFQKLWKLVPSTLSFPRLSNFWWVLIGSFWACACKLSWTLLSPARVQPL